MKRTLNLSQMNWYNPDDYCISKTKTRLIAQKYTIVLQPHTIWHHHCWLPSMLPVHVTKVADSAQLPGMLNMEKELRWMKTLNDVSHELAQF